MEHRPSEDLNTVFRQEISNALLKEQGTAMSAQVSDYLADLLIRFLHTDSIFAVKNASGQRIVSITEMMAEGDILQNADSFERERQVHRHIGDFILFWSGIFPHFLSKIRLREVNDLTVDYSWQAKESYHVVSLFDMPPHDVEAPLYRSLSKDFELYRHCLQQVGKRIGTA